MSIVETTSHFWVAAPPLFSTTLFVGTSSDVEQKSQARSVIEIFDVEGTKVNTVEVEFPAGEVGVIEMEPFVAGLKMQGGVAHGHLSISSPLGTRHLCRQSIGGNVALYQDPVPVRQKESSFVPVVVGGRREHMVALVNHGAEEGQIACRLFYGNRSPEWTVTVPGNGSRLLFLEGDFLATSDDRVWEKGAVQAYVRFSGKQTSPIAAHIIERSMAESPEHDSYRCLVSWG